MKPTDLTHDEINGVLLNLLASVTGSVFFGVQLHIDEPSKGHRFYIAIKCKREGIWVEYIHRVPFSAPTVGYVWQPEQTVVSLSMRIIITAIEKADWHNLEDKSQSRPISNLV